jgi:hypothetical protein
MDLEIRPIEPSDKAGLAAAVEHSLGVVRVLSREAGAVELAVDLSPRVAD